MRIGNSTGSPIFTGNQAHKAGGQDSQTQSIQKQIREVQEQLKSLGQNKEMSVEEKAAKRKELEEQLAELNKQLAERQLAKKQEDRKKNQSAQAANENPARSKTTSGGMGTAAMQSIIGAGNSMKQVAISNGAKSQLEGKASVLETEIKIDQSQGGSTERKEAELAEVEAQINTVSNDIMSNIAEITEELNNAGTKGEKEEAAKTDKSKAKTGPADTDKNDVKTNPKDDLADGNSGREPKPLSASESPSTAPDVSAGPEGTSANPNLIAGTMETYVPVDIKL